MDASWGTSRITPAPPLHPPGRYITQGRLPMPDNAHIPELLRRFEAAMVETGRKLIDINLLLDGLMKDVLSSIEGNRFPLETDFAHYGNSGHRVLHAIEVVLDAESGTITVHTAEGEPVLWEELGVSTKDYMANIIVLKLISDANFEALRQ